MNQINERAVLDQPASNQTVIIFENIKKEETAEAEERLRRQRENQRKIEEEISRKEEEARNKPHEEPV